MTLFIFETVGDQSVTAFWQFKKRRNLKFNCDNLFNVLHTYTVALNNLYFCIFSAKKWLQLTEWSPEDTGSNPSNSLIYTQQS